MAMAKKKLPNFPVQVCEHEQFGNIRYVLIEDEPWFVATDICKVLEIKNPRDAVSSLDDDEIMTVGLNDGHSRQRGGAQFFNVVNEPGLYRLIFKSRKPEANQFKRWVCHEVLPSIRKNGYYVSPKQEVIRIEAGPKFKEFVAQYPEDAVKIIKIVFDEEEDIFGEIQDVAYYEVIFDKRKADSES